MALCKPLGDRFFPLIAAVNAHRNPPPRIISLTDEFIRNNIENMPRAISTRPTDAELDILGVLWKRGASTVREVHDELNLVKPTGYTTVLKFLQIMMEKGLVQRDEMHRVQVYEATKPRETTQNQLVRDLAERAFGGSPLQLAMRALATDRATPEELAQIRNLLDECERNAQ